MMDLGKPPIKNDQIYEMAVKASHVICSQSKGAPISIDRMTWIIDSAMRQGYDIGLKAGMVIHDLEG